jgi:hypothetical protein
LESVENVRAALHAIAASIDDKLESHVLEVKEQIVEIEALFNGFMDGSNNPGIPAVWQTIATAAETANALDTQIFDIRDAIEAAATQM